ncbi:MAG TPA: hypothetical protein VIP27_00360 [Variovorax sp.]
MFFSKTDKARDELRPGRRTLTQRERAVLLMADGQRSVTDFVPLFADRDEAVRVARHLLHEGYLHAPEERYDAPSVVVADVPAPPSAPAVSADPFDGKPSLATTRMFLFDLCERLFARRDPAMAQVLRDTLREARDRASMLAVADTMLAGIRQAAGDERANAIGDRIARLLPPETMH